MANPAVDVFTYQPPDGGSGAERHRNRGRDIQALQDTDAEGFLHDDDVSSVTRRARG